MKKTPPSFSQPSCRLKIKVTPRSHRSEVLGQEEGWLRVRLKATPREGAANRAMIEFLSEILSLPKKNIKILHGEKSRIKEVEIIGLNKVEAMAAVLRPHES